MIYPPLGISKGYESHPARFFWYSESVDVWKGEMAMLVSTKGRYALRVMVDLAEHQADGRIPLKEIAERQHVSEKYLENILSTLVRNNMLSGMRGKGGGYRLTRPAEEYSVGEILRLTEGSLSPVSCLDGDRVGCEHVDGCSTIRMWMKLDEMISTYLDGVSVADLASAPHGLKDIERSAE